MRIQSINNSKMGYTTKVSSQNQRKSPNFQATLTISENARRAIVGETFQRFNHVMEEFGKELKNSKLAPYGAVYIQEPKQEVLIDTKYGKEKANLLMSGFNREVNFFYNIQSTNTEIIKDLCKTFEYLLTVDEKQPDNVTIREVNTDCSDDILDFQIYYYSRMP